jgi:hypothetical protein
MSAGENAMAGTGKLQIRHRYSGAVLFEIDGADLCDADLRGAILRGAILDDGYPYRGHRSMAEVMTEEAGDAV